MEEVLAGPRAKIARAREHIAAVRDLGSRLPPIALSHPNLNPGDLEPADEPEAFFFNLRVEEAPEVPPGASLTVGDAVQNLRAALEYTAWQGYIDAAGDPLRGNHVHFPICDRPEDFDGWGVRQLSGLPESKIAAIRDCQPFASSKFEPLSLLRWLTNQDKHRALVLTAWAPGLGSSKIVDVTGCDSAEIQFLVGDPIEVGMVIVRVKLWNPTPQLQMTLLMDWKPFLAFTIRGSVDDWLGRMATSVEAAIDDVASVFARPDVGA